MVRTRKKLLHEQLKHRVSQMYLQGYTMLEIADRLDISVDRVFDYIKQLIKRWQESQQENVGIAVQKTLASLDLMERELWDAWERSKQGRKRKRINVITNKNAKEPVVTEHEEEVFEEAGDPRFLEALQKVIQRRAALLGMDAPKRTEGTLDVRARVLSYDASKQLSPDDRANILIGLLKEAKERGYNPEQIESGDRPDSELPANARIVEQADRNNESGTKDSTLRGSEGQQP